MTVIEENKLKALLQSFIQDKKNAEAIAKLHAGQPTENGYLRQAEILVQVIYKLSKFIDEIDQ